MSNGPAGGSRTYQMTGTAPDARITVSRVMSVRPAGLRGGDDETVERVAREAQLVGKEDLVGRQIEWLISRVAEQIVEKSSNAPPQIHASRAREQAALPHHCRRHVENGFPALAPRKERGGAGAKTASARRVKEERMGISDGAFQFSHEAFVISRDTWPPALEPP